LLVVVSIIGMLTALLLPPIQQSREAARAAECKSHLHQIAQALLLREESRGNLPSSGWGWKWPPHSDRGDSEHQPGSWVYCVLPYLEQMPLYSDRTPDETRLATVLPMFYCPSRRPAELYPCGNHEVYAPRPPLVAKSDYAANCGDHDEPNSAGPGGVFVQPETLVQGDDPGWWTAQGVVRDSNGLIFQRSSVRFSDIVDGTAHTYLVGEKSLDPLHYTTGDGLGDMESVYHGDDDDTSRVTFFGDGPPRQDAPGLASRTLFGSAHAAVCHFAMADGSVQSIGYGIDVETHRRLGNRRDGLPETASAGL
jgi:hypothetical protein